VSLQNEIKTLIAGQSRIVGETAVDSSSIAILKWISEITPDEIAIERLGWGNAFSEMELRRNLTNQKMQANGSVDANKAAAMKELLIKGTVYKDVFYADIHLLKFMTALEKNPFFQDIQLIEKRRGEGDPVLVFELTAKKK
ncbi:hypothetical protein JNM05_15655, partial [bacterium]|nr:hypothetical protein [bacterium]